MGTDSTIIQHEGDIWSEEKEKTPVTTPGLVISTQQKASPQREREEKITKLILRARDRMCQTGLVCFPASSASSGELRKGSGSRGTVHGSGPGVFP